MILVLICDYIWFFFFIFLLKKRCGMGPRRIDSLVWDSYFLSLIMHGSSYGWDREPTLVRYLKLMEKCYIQIPNQWSWFSLFAMVWWTTTTDIRHHYYVCSITTIVWSWLFYAKRNDGCYNSTVCVYLWIFLKNLLELENFKSRFGYIFLYFYINKISLQNHVCIFWNLNQTN